MCWICSLSWCRRGRRPAGPVLAVTLCRRPAHVLAESPAGLPRGDELAEGGYLSELASVPVRIIPGTDRPELATTLTDARARTRRGAAAAACGAVAGGRGDPSGRRPVHGDIALAVAPPRRAGTVGVVVAVPGAGASGLGRGAGGATRTGIPATAPRCVEQRDDRAHSRGHAGAAQKGPGSAVELGADCSAAGRQG